MQRVRLYFVAVNNACGEERFARIRPWAEDRWAGDRVTE
jgi:hypothetical protein